MTLFDTQLFPDLLSAAARCRGEVFLETDQGDRLNLKSTLSQFAFAAGFEALREMHCDIVCDPGDLPLLAPFLRGREDD